MKLDGIDIGTVAQRLVGEREHRLSAASKLIPFGVSYLDDALGGIFPHDLVVLTARPGAGKTQLASTIAEGAAKAGRRVLGLFLEADRGEIERRMKFRALAAGYASGAARRAAAREPATLLSYSAWMRGELEDVLGDGDDVGRALGRQLGDRMHTVYRGSAFSLEDTERVMVAMQDRVDLFVVDHLHYLDVADETNELRAVTAIMTKLRDLSLRLGKPVLLVAHLRKEDKLRASVVPSLADLHGTSNVVRIATRVITLAPAPRDCSGAWHLSPTYVSILKDRIDGATPLVARVVYDKTAGIYRDAYELGIVSGDSWDAIIDMPHWARRAV